MKYIHIVLCSLLSLFCSCADSYDQDILNLNNKTVKFSELPAVVQNKIIYPDGEFCIDSEKLFGCTLFCFDQKGNYEIKAIHPRFGSRSWISYMKLTDRNKQISYRIATNRSSPYFIFENKLYISQEYNFIGYNRTIERINELDLMSMT